MSRSRRTACRISLAFLLVLATGQVASAGVPFLTDDAETLELGHYEINLGSSYTHRQGDTGGNIIGVEVNYGVTERFQAHAYVPLAFDHVSGGATYVGIGDIELGFKYHLADAAEWADWAPAIAVEPTIDFPAGAQSHNLGTGSVHAFIPVWASKSWDQLTVFGGGGFAINPGSNNRNWAFTGIGTTYNINEKWTLGGELFYTTPSVSGLKDGIGFNIGGNYNINETYHVFFSVGRNIINAKNINIFSSFLGVQVTF
jgi:hypothetical protein